MHEKESRARNCSKAKHLGYSANLLSVVCALTVPLVQLSTPAIAGPLPPSSSVRHNVANPSNNSLINLNLSSKRASGSAAQIIGKAGTVSINVGGKRELVSSGALLTPAEILATYQVLSSGQQSLVLSILGNAIGGNFSIGPQFSHYFSSLEIPHGVTALQNAAIVPALSLQGSLTNAGNIVEYSSNASATSASISASAIVNSAGGIITSSNQAAILPANMANAAQRLSLSLNSGSSISNSGAIISSDQLTMAAANSISNLSPAGANTQASGIKAENSINLVANQIVNKGLIVSQSGNLTMQSASGGSLSINSNNGTFQALNGKIAINAAATSTANGITINGGNFLSPEINLDAGQGFVKGYAGNVSGVVNINAESADFGAATRNLRFGVLNVQGDPTYYNTNGSISLASVSATDGAALALIASQDIVVTGGAIDTTDPTDGTASTPSTNNGGDITIIAGANFTAGGGPSSGLPAQSTTTLTITGASSTGGAIDLSGVSSIDSNGTQTLNGRGGDGGNILIMAFSGSGLNSSLSIKPGTVNLGTSGSINSFGTGGPQVPVSNGNVTIIAGAISDSSNGVAALTVPAIFAASSQTNSDAGILEGNVGLFTATPTISAGGFQILNGQIQGTVSYNYSSVPQTTNWSQAATNSSLLSVNATNIGYTNPQANSSVNIGALGGSSTLSFSSATAAQNAIAQYTYSQVLLPDKAASPDKPRSASLTYNMALQNAAMAEAEYLAANSNFVHYDLSGAGPTERGGAVGINTNNAFCCGENIGEESVGFNITPASFIKQVDLQMIGEQDVSGTHAYNILNGTFVGVGFANNGTNYFLVEDFSYNSTAPSFIPMAATPVHGGIGGGAGIIAVTPGITESNAVQPNTTALGTIYGSNIFPTSISANFVGIRAGNTTTAAGAIIAMVPSNDNHLRTDTGGIASVGGNVSIYSGGNINLWQVQANGSSGASGAAGGAAGTVFITSANGNISVNPTGSNCAPCLAVSAVGGNGGWSLNAGEVGGAGGAGGLISLLAPNGSISASVIEAGGGGGSGGSAGAGLNTGGAGGAGGAGGSINLAAGQGITIGYYLDASGGGGGGAGGSGTSTSLSAGGGGGGGGSFGFAGYGGSTIGSGGGGGGGGGEIAATGGSTNQSVYYLMASSTGGASTEAGGAGGGFALGGAGGASTTDAGGAGGATGQAGASDALNNSQGGAAGAGGTITLSGQPILIQGNVGKFWTSYRPFAGAALSVGFANDSILALGSPNTGSVTISTSTTISQVYATNANLTDTLPQDRVPVVIVGGNFLVGNASGGNGTFGDIEVGQTGQASSPITINSVASNSPLSTGSFASASGASTISIQVGLNQVQFSNGSLATPAELIAVIQQAGSGQTLTLDSNGAATGGTFAVQANNVPGGGFTTLVLPAGVTENDNISSLSYSTSATISGALQVSSVSGTATITTPILTINAGGSLVDTRSSGILNIQSSVSITNNSILSLFSGTLTTPSLTNNGTISSSGGALNIQSPGGANLSISGTGSLSSVGFPLTLTASSGAMELSGNITITSPSAVLNASAALQVDNGSTVNNTTGSITANSGYIFNQNGLTASSLSLNVAPPGATLGTLVNSNGNVVLTNNTIVNTAGKSLLIIASGDVSSSGISTINLSSSKGDGGSLTVLAGFAFSPVTAGGQILDTTTTQYTASAASATGGSINLANVTINTSSTSTVAGSTQGGNVTLISSEVAGASAGVVLTGAINTSASAGQGGNLTIMAPGGIVVNGSVNTKGSSGSGGVSLSATPYTHGSITAADGYLSPSANFAVSAPANGSGSAVAVKGGISTGSSTGNGGIVTVTAESSIVISGAIETSGQKSAGAVSLSSLNGALTVVGEINASGLNGTSALAPGSGASITLSVPEFAVIQGSLRANGGNSIVAGQNAGLGANITVQTSDQDDAAQGFFTGKVSILGYVDSAGGSAITKTGGGAGGIAGSVTIDAGAFQVTGQLGTASILASGGAGFAGAGSNGNVTLSTYAVQVIPSNFNLDSAAATEYALPGGLFNTGGSFAVVNGTAGNIVSGANIATKTNAGELKSGTFKLGTIAITVSGGAQSVSINGVASTIATASSSNVRLKVTPAVALALYQLSSLDQQQTIGITTKTDQASAVNPQTLTASTLTVSDFDLPQSFTSFVLATATPLQANGITLNINGLSPVLNLPASLLNGQINFSNNNQALINSGTISLLNGASISTTNSLAFLSGSIVTAFGSSINAGTIQLLRPLSTLAFTNNGTLNSSQILLQSKFSPSLISITNGAKGIFNASIDFAPLQLSTDFSPAIAAMTNGSAPTFTTSLILNIPNETCKSEEPSRESAT